VPSPYEAIFGDVVAALHPTLQTYFGEIPDGSTGVGVGTFDVVGTPRLWLWPALGVLGTQGIMFPAWRHRVRFSVLNHPVIDARGNTAILAHHLFHFRIRTRRMEDAITAERGRLVDHLGFSRRIAVRLSATAVRGELHLRSLAVSIRVGRLHLRIPRRIAPTVSLIERFDEHTQRQHVSLTVDLPRLGRVYEYAGTFTYEIRKGVWHG
jgi:hypothetical protein